MSQSWLIASGKGGVGKSMVTAALGVALARKSMHCCCVDADLGLRDLDMVLGLQNRVVYDMMDVAHKDCKMRSALVSHTRYENLSLLPAAQSARAKDLDSETFGRIIHKLKKRYGYILTDAPAGVDRGLCNLVPASDHCILVVTPDDVSIRDAERVLALLEAEGKGRPMLIVNRVVEKLVARNDMYSPQTVASTLDIPLLGYIPEAGKITECLCRHESFMEMDCPASRAIERICLRFLGEYVPMPSPRMRHGWFHRSTHY